MKQMNRAGGQKATRKRWQKRWREPEAKSYMDEKDDCRVSERGQEFRWRFQKAITSLDKRHMAFLPPAVNIAKKTCD